MLRRKRRDGYPNIPRIELRRLDRGRELGRGGEGRVIAINNYLIDDRWPAVLKLFLPALAGPPNISALRALVELRNQLDTAQSRWLNEHTAWPAAIVEDNGVARGYLMRAASDKYYVNFYTKTGESIRRLAEIAILLNSDDYVRRAGIEVTDQQRLALLRSIATTLSHLHALDAVIGDLSPRNLLFSLSPSPSSFLISCDAVKLRDQTVLPQLETPDWQRPTGEVVSVTSDRYKFGMLAIRLIARNSSSRSSLVFRTVSTELAALAEASQDDRPWERPSMDSWAVALDKAISGATYGISADVAASKAAPSPRELTGHAFISYVREDSDKVNQLQHKLQSSGILVWRDTTELWPGEDWRAKIREAITHNALVFIVCFSSSSLARGRSYQNEELQLAIEQMRLRRPDVPWLLPVRLDECEVPDWEIGGGRTLSSIQRADLFGDRYVEDSARLVAAILGILRGTFE